MANRRNGAELLVSNIDAAGDLSGKGDCGVQRPLHKDFAFGRFHAEVDLRRTWALL